MLAGLLVLLSSPQVQAQGQAQTQAQKQAQGQAQVQGQAQGQGQTQQQMLPPPLAALPPASDVLAPLASHVLSALAPTAAEVRRGSPFAVAWAPELVLTAGALLVPALADAAVAPAMRTAPACRLTAVGLCDPQALTALDRRALRAPSRAWQRSSDVLQAGGVALSLLTVAVQAALDAQPRAGMEAAAVRTNARPMLYAAADMLVATEAVAASTLVTSVVKYAVRRPRPGQYRSGARSGTAQMLSFPSGHTGAVAAAGFALASITQLRRPGTAWSRGAWAGAVVLTAATATGRVLGGQHFPTDVVAGAVLGAALGVAVPALHRRQVGVQPALGLHGGAGLSLHTTF